MEEGRLKEVNQLNIPPIFIDENPKEEVKIFFKSLHNKNYPWMRRMILGIDDFQPLKVALEAEDIHSKEQEKEVIGDFLKGFRDKNQDQIQVFIEHSKQELENKSEKALEELALLMDYQWTEDFPGYRVVPVLLPFSPFGENVFFFSILDAAQKVKQNNLLNVAIHEISHMILFDLLEKYHLGKPNFEHSSCISIDYLKEILAPVLMVQPPLKKLLNLSEFPGGYLENDELIQLYIKDANSSEDIQIIKYFQKFYSKLRYTEHKTFQEILEVMFGLFTTLEGDLTKRTELWNKYHYRIFKEEALLEEYSKPIRIDKP